ncbi:MAG TPA: sulfite exporter TauE/SafE family protein, partial [Gallionella sp.]|nr:sulfite exporter TauE/SafE family protein [Gallionella sp.]
WYAAYLVLGAVAGFLGGLFGIGGGTVLVPVLLLLFEAQHFPAEHVMHLALGSSMAVILLTSIASTHKHHQHGAVEWRVVFSISPGILLGTAIGSLVSASISPYYLTIFFALFMCFAASQILLNVKPYASRQLPGIAGMTLMGTFTGWISTLVSVGGGTLTVPFLIWCNVPIRRAIGTASAIGFPIAVGGTIGYILTGLHAANLPAPNLGYVYLPAMLGCALVSIITAPLGAKTAHRTNVAMLRKLFAVMLIGLAVKLLWKVLG